DPWGNDYLNGTYAPNYLGHRDVGQTACPGDFMYAHMGSFRNAAYARYDPIPVIGAIRAKWDSLGGAPGKAVAAEYPVNSSGGQWLGQAQDFSNGRLIWDANAGGAYWIHGGILAKYDLLGREAGFLGMPRSDEYGVAEGRANDFSGGRIYWSAGSGSFSVGGAILGKLLSDGGVTADGFPTTDEYDVPGISGARAGNFARSRIYWSPGGGTHTVFGGIMGRYLLLGGPAAYGLPTSDEHDTAGYSGGRVSDFSNGRVYWGPEIGTWGMSGAIGAKYVSLGGPAWGRGLPINAEYAAANGRAQNLQNALLTWEGTLGSHAVYGGINGMYQAMGGFNGYLGLPASDEGDVDGISGARYMIFQSGRIYWSAATGPHSVIGAINQIYVSSGGPAVAGLPVSNEFDISGVPGGREGDFQRGRIYYHPTAGTNLVYGGLLGKYLLLGGPAGVMGLPTSAERDIAGVTGGRQEDFQRGRLFWTAASGGHAVNGAILGKYLEYGGPTSALGLPVSDEYAIGSGRRSDFTGGYIYWSTQTGSQIFMGSAATVTSDAAFEVRDGGGVLLASLAAGQSANVVYSGGVYTLQAPGVFHTGNSGIRMASPSGGIMQVTSYHDVPAWNPNLDDNRFRGTIEVRYSPVSNAVWVINELPVESYMRGIAETGSGSPMEFLKTMTVAARSYAIWHLDRNGKYGAAEIFHLKNSRNGNGDDQQYKGYGFEARFPDLSSAVNATAGQVVTYGGAVAMTAYFSNSDGRTRSAQEAWGISSWPWLQSVADPDCNGMSLNGHGVGLSGVGALARANRGNGYQSILGYYYTGTAVQQVNTARNIRIALARIS
ncbi:MAG: SpoIID/LytB domain-containing protein, partial [Thermoleophilia bacterium]